MKNTTLREEVFQYICLKKLVETRDLVDIFKEQGFSKQAIYKSLRQLVNEEKVLFRSQQVAINYVWLIKEIQSLSTLLPDYRLVHENYARKQAYRMKTLNELDAVFAQIFVSLLVSQREKLSNALFYDLHNYTYLHKVSLVDWYIDLLNKKFDQICLLVGSESPLDKHLKKKMDIPVHLIPKRWNVFFSVIGDFVISNYIDQKISKRMDYIFETMTTSEATKEIQKLAQMRGSYRITVERNMEKSKEIRRVFEKYFALRTIK